MNPELVVLMVVVVLAFWGARTTDTNNRYILAFFFCCIVGSWFFFLAYQHRPTKPSHTHSPARVLDREYVGSETCKSCHPGQHNSWYRSYHRSMTQVPSVTDLPWSEQSVSLELEGRSYSLVKQQDKLIARTAGLDLPVLLTTGSHHYQVYWLPSERVGALEIFPFVYLIDEKKWVPRHEVFVQPPHSQKGQERWNSNCIQCHTVAGQPGRDPKSLAYESKTAELGIACEACHGVGQKHVQNNKNPLVRYVKHLTHNDDSDIVNPSKIAPQKGSEVCGQCHSYFFPKNENAWWKDGFLGRAPPSARLEASRTILSLDVWSAADAPILSVDAKSLFWADGSVRVAGREFHGVQQSPCVTKAPVDKQMSCMSCHSIHKGDRNDQLAPETEGDRMCTQCHKKYENEPEKHTFHARSTPGGRCIDCHMSKTTYGLLTAIHSHKIDSPSVKTAEPSAKPVACNLCHLDRSLQWSADYLSQRYGQPAVEKDNQMGDNFTTAAGVLWVAKADAGVRALIASALWSDDCSSSSRGAFTDVLLAWLDTDPYDAIRHISRRSRVQLTQREQNHQMSAKNPSSASSKSTTPIDANSLRVQLEHLSLARDNSPVVLAE